jgi:hypothetical protein
MFATGASALIQLDRAAKEWIGLVAYRLPLGAAAYRTSIGGLLAQLDDL